MQTAYQLIASVYTVVFIAIVYYLLVLWQYPAVPLTTGYILGPVIAISGISLSIKAKAKEEMHEF